MAPILRSALAAFLLGSCQPDSGIGEPCEVPGDCRAPAVCGPAGTCVAEDCSDPGITLDISPTRALTLLLVVDDSGSMTEEQASFAAELPRLLQALLLGYDEPTGRSFPAIEDLRLGVVTTDMGTGPNGVCESAFGEDGVLQTRGDIRDPDCARTYPTWLSFADMDLFSEQPGLEARCVLGAVGTEGCGFEQPLEATLKALTPSTSGVTFAGGTVGHGDGQNGGFVQPDGVLAVVTLTDEDDCSTTVPELFDAESDTYGPNLNLRCHEHADVLHPLERYLDGLLDLDTAGLVYAPIAGVPPELVPDPSEPLAPQLEALLDDARMQERPNPDDSTQLVPSCDVAGRGRAYPPRRLVELTARLEERGASVALGSICQESQAGPMGRIVAAIADAIDPRCLPRSYARDSEGRVPCELLETLHPMSGLTCEDLPGRTLDAIDDVGRSVCVVEQRGTADGTAPTGAGWYYDDFSERTLERCSESPQRIAFTPGADPAPGSRLSMDCSEASAPIWGSPCGRRPARCAEAVTPRYLPGGLICDPVSERCLPPCTDDADCLGGFRCERGYCQDLSCLER